MGWPMCCPAMWNRPAGCHFVIPSSESHLVDFDPDVSKATYDLLHGQWKLDADGVGAAYPFGWGLGFGTCQVESAVVDDSGADAGRRSVAVVVTNTLHRRTSTVVQVYGEKLGLCLRAATAPTDWICESVDRSG